MDIKWLSYHEATEIAYHDVLMSPKATISRGWAIRLGGCPCRKPPPARTSKKISTLTLWLVPRYYEGSGLEKKS
jgi:hypothetical protein